MKEGKVVIIDRKKDIFKLSQGEFVVPTRIESECIKVRKSKAPFSSSKKVHLFSL